MVQRLYFLRHRKTTILLNLCSSRVCDRNSAVECLPSKQNVVGSNPIGRSFPFVGSLYVDGILGVPWSPKPKMSVRFRLHVFKEN